MFLPSALFLPFPIRCTDEDYWHFLQAVLSQSLQGEDAQAMFEVEGVAMSHWTPWIHAHCSRDCHCKRFQEHVNIFSATGSDPTYGVQGSSRTTFRRSVIQTWQNASRGYVAADTGIAKLLPVGTPLPPMLSFHSNTSSSCPEIKLIYQLT